MAEEAVRPISDPGGHVDAQMPRDRVVLLLVLAVELEDQADGHRPSFRALCDRQFHACPGRSSGARRHAHALPRPELEADRLVEAVQSRGMRVVSAATWWLRSVSRRRSCAKRSSPSCCSQSLSISRTISRIAFAALWPRSVSAMRLKRWSRGSSWRCK